MHVLRALQREDHRSAKQLTLMLGEECQAMISPGAEDEGTGRELGIGGPFPVEDS